jgi:ketosteroid isomerase-like protein
MPATASGDRSETLRLVERLRPHGPDPLLPALAGDVEWWAAGPPAILPWAGTFRGRAEVERWFRELNELMHYERFEVRETYADGDTVVQIAEADGYAVATRRPFATQIVRVWTVRDGKVASVRSYYDTDAYVRALTTDER